MTWFNVAPGLVVTVASVHDLGCKLFNKPMRSMRISEWPEHRCGSFSVGELGLVLGHTGSDALVLTSQGALGWCCVSSIALAWQEAGR